MTKYKSANRIVNDIDIGYWKIKESEIYWSEAFIRKLGYAQDKVDIKLDFFLKNLVHKDDANLFRNNLFSFIKSNIGFRQSMLLKTAKGKYKEFVCTTSTSISSNCGEGFKFVFFNKRKIKTNKKVKKNKFYSKETSELSQTGSWYIDFLKKKCYWDQLTRRILEYPEDYIPSIRKASNYYPKEYHEEVKRLFSECAHEGKFFDCEVKMLTKNKRAFWVRAIGKPVYNKNKIVIGIRGVFQDINTTKVKELSLQRTSGIIASQNKRLFNFAHIVSHNLRSHTSNLSLIVELVNSFDDPDEKLELLNSVADVTKSLSETIEHLNEVVTIQTSTNKSKTQVNFADVLNQVTTSISQIINKENVIINTDFSKLENIDYIPAYLESILLNLVTNAIKYKHPDRDPIINIKSYIKNTYSILEIEDNGIGIDLKKHGKKLFGMYNTFHNNDDAVGIGLFITKNQIESLNGKITVTSKIQKSTSFKIIF